MTKSFVILIFLTGLIVSCQNSDKEQKKTETEKEKDTISLTTEITSDEDRFPFDFKILTYIVIPNTSGHDTDELKNLQKQKLWFGFYHVEGKSFEIKPVSIRFEREFDGIMDNENGPYTGIRTVADSNENCLFAFNPIFNIEPKNLNAYLPLNTVFKPGTKKTFRVNGIEYTLSASGKRVKEEYLEGIKDYKLVLSYVNSDASEKEILLMKLPTYEEYETPSVQVVFAGKMDSDNFPDFVLKDNNQYYLYLSAGSKNEKQAICVGTEVIFGGC